MKHLRRLRPALGLAITAFILVWALRDISPREAVSRVRAADPGLLALAVALAMATIPLRAGRWHATLKPTGTTSAGHALLHSLSLGLMANNVLPARSGELVRAWAAEKLAGVPFSAALGSIALERLLDVVAILSLLGLGLVAGHLPAAIPGDVQTAVTVALVAGAGLIGLGIVAATLRKPPDWPNRLAARLHKRFRWTRSQWLRTRLSEIGTGLAAARDPRLMLVLLAWSVVIWSTNAAAFWIGMLAFQIDLPWTGPLLVQAFVAFGVLLPSTPGYFGPFEAACVFALGLYGIHVAAAASFAITFHLTAYFLPVVALGVWSLSRSGIAYSEIRRLGK